MTAELTFRTMIESDWPAIETIYSAGIETGHATFETAPPSTWEAFISGKHASLRLVAIDENGELVGWAAASPVSAREVYKGVVEHSVYVHPEAHGLGIGSRLLSAFIELADEAGVWTIQSSIFPENAASLRLHEQQGFRVVGQRKRIARMTYGPLAGMWRDTVLVEFRR